MTSAPRHPMLSHLPRALARTAAAGLTGGLTLALSATVAAPVASGAPAAAADATSTYAAGVDVRAAAPAAAAATVTRGDRLPPGRRIVIHVVRRGDTATGLAVRYHAWTRELIALNRLGSSARLHLGQRLRIPVVIAAEQRAKATRPPARKPTTKSTTTWKYADPDRATVRRVIVATARRIGVDPELALAISWQEAGWQMHHVSHADAIGAMQVIPDTGTWMEQYAGRRLNLYDLRDNVLAGVLLLRVLDKQTTLERRQIGAYYQGLGAVRRHGLYPETRAYVANVQAIRRRLEAGRSPG